MYTSTNNLKFLLTESQATKCKILNNKPVKIYFHTSKIILSINDISKYAPSYYKHFKPHVTA